MSTIQADRRKRLPQRLPPNWRDRIELVEESPPRNDGGIDFVWQWIKGRTPRRFGRLIGRISVDSDGHVEEIDLEEKFQGKRMGLALYVKALRTVGVLKTNTYHCTPEARRCWKSLAKRFPHKKDFWTGRLEIRCRSTKTCSGVKSK